MRHILLAMLFSLGLAACSETVIEPEQFACQAPQTAQLSKQFASDLCVQNVIVADLNATGPALEEATHALLNQQENQVTAEPTAIRCRLLEGQTYCAFNSYWASRAPAPTHYNGTSSDFSPPFDTLGLTPPINAVHG
jgi:hypothetical protein